jgi:hypothetical protein
LWRDRREAGSFAALRNDNQENKSKSNNSKSRFPTGMTARKTRATTKDKSRSRFPTGMTERKTRATATATAKATAEADPSLRSG